MGSSKAVQQKFVSLFMRSKKTSLFLSGHSHNFEHFKKNGKDFLVIGGGGGLHQPLYPGTDDLADIAPEYKPMFHYLTVRRLPGHVLVTSYRLNDDFKDFTTVMVMNITKPNPNLWVIQKIYMPVIFPISVFYFSAKQGYWQILTYFIGTSYQ